MFWKVVAPLLAALLAVSSAGLLGAPADADLNEPGVQNALQFAVAQYNRASNDMFTSQVSKVISVKKQVVSGLKYIFTVEMARTSCRKDGEVEECPFQEQNAQPSTCTFAVWSQPWLNSIKLVQNNCK